MVIGREDEYARLEAARQRADHGNGSCLLITGEPGAGKSHLLSAAGAAWREDGAVVLDGACESFAADELAYGPFVQAWSRVDAAHGGGFADLLAALAGLGELPVEVARAWLFDRVARQLDELAADRAVAVVLEDVHWADRATVGLLRFLARAVRRRRWLLVVTARSDGADGLGAADELVDLVASGQVERVVLGVLPPTQIRTLVVRVLGERWEEDVVNAIVARAGGNPYLAHELAAAATHDRDGLPSTLHRVLLRRITAHGEAAEIALATVALAAEAPAEVVDAALAASVGLAMAGTVSALLRSALLVPAPGGGGVRLRHAVLGEVAVGRLPADRLREVHRALAVAWAGDPAAARHWECAGELRRALHDWLAAGRAAGRSSAYSTAAHAYSRVLELAGAVQMPERQPAEFALEAADAMYRAGDDEHAVRALRSALASGQVLDDVQRLALLERLQTCCSPRDARRTPSQ